MRREIIRQYNEAVLDTDRAQAMEVVHGALHDGMTPEEIIFDLIVPALEDMISSVSERRDTSLAQHFMASQIASEVTEEMIPLFAHAPDYIGRMVIGTSAGDFHGLGKRIVSGCLKAQMIDVTDLGLNVAPERFVDEAVRLGASVIGVSSMMVHTARGENGAHGVRRILKERGLESKIKLIVGGAPYRYDHELVDVVEADGWAENGIAAGPVIAGLMQGVRP